MEAVNGSVSTSVGSLLLKSAVPSLLPSMVLVLLIIYISSYYIRTHRQRQLLAKIPGYKQWPIVGDVLHLERDPQKFYAQILQLMEENRGNQIAKLMIGNWPLVGVYTPEQVERLLSSNELIDKSSDYDVLHKWLGTGLLTSTGSKWRKRRKQLTPSFHFNILQDFLLVMNDHAQQLKDKFMELSTHGKTVDVFPFITLNALDMICETAMGVQIDALHQTESEYVKSVYLVKDATAIRQRSPWLWPDFIYNRLSIGQKVNKSIEYMHNFANKVIEDRHAHFSADPDGSSLKRKAFLDMLLTCTDENGQHLSFPDIREEVDTFMFEGHDTVSAATAYTVHLLGANPDIQKKCHDELDEIFECNRTATMDDLRKMSYLEACIKESLRIFPSVPWFARALSQDTDFAGYLVPKGTTVTVFVSALHRDPDIYPDPEKFDPSRFHAKNSSQRHPFAYVPFSAGPRNCIGQKFAMMELKVTVSSILRHFTITSTQTRDELLPNPGLILQPSVGIRVKLECRQ